MHPIMAALPARLKPSVTWRAAPLHLPPTSLLALQIPAACWDIHRPPHPPLQSGAAQCPSLPQHQQLRQGDIHRDIPQG